MKVEFINQIKNIAENKSLISVNDIKDKLKINYNTALIYLLEMEIKKILRRHEMSREGSSRTFRFWRINDEDDDDDTKKTT